MHKRKKEEILRFICSLYPNEAPVPLHAPRFLGNEKKYLMECVDSTFVSYVGKFVAEFEDHIKRLTGAGFAVATVNGTAALHMALLAAGVKPGDEVITQALTFVATAASIKHAGAEPVFLDVERETLGMSPDALKAFLTTHAKARRDGILNRISGRRIAAIVPMHTFGHPVRIDEISGIAAEYNIQVIEDAAESLGTLYRGRHMGRFGHAAILSFNGNKAVTTGGGGMVITDESDLAERVRHISTTAKRKHQWEYYHDDVGYNLRLPNVNAALGCAQMEYFDRIIANKRETAELYRSFFASIGVRSFVELPEAQANYWLNVIMLKDRADRNDFLIYSNDHGVQTRPVWTLLTKLPPYAHCATERLSNAEWLEDRVVNIPSSVRV